MMRWLLLALSASQCKLLYCPWYFSQSQLDELYAIMPDNSMGNEKKALLKTQRSYVKKLSKDIHKVKDRKSVV